MTALSKVLMAAGMSMLFTTAYANEAATGARSDAPKPQQQSQQSAQPGAGSSTATGSGSQDGTTQANEPGPGVRHGNNEGGSKRTDTTAEQPTATPGTGEAIEPKPSETKPQRPAGSSQQ